MVRNLIINNILKDEIYPDNNLKEYDNIFIFYRNKYKEKIIQKSVLENIQEFYEAHSYLVYKNIIVIPSLYNNDSILNDNILYICWFSNNTTSYFNKDNIREKHIWKDIEWGKRKRNYSEKGKDPGNVWIPTEDNGKGKVNKHIELNLNEVINRLYKAFDENINTIWEYEFVNSSKLEIEEYLNKNLRQIKNNKKEANKIKINKTTELDQNYELIFDTSEIKVNSNKEGKLVITSPPYWDLKNYYKDGQIGHETYSSYIKRLNKVWENMHQSLKEDGQLWININIRTKQNKPIFIPSDFIKEIRKIGFTFVDIIIWHKTSGLPGRFNNLADKYEFLLIFSKSKNNIIINNFDFEDYQAEGINGGNIWKINRKAGSIGKKFKHPAIFPNELVNRAIIYTTLENEIVIDPFLGSGTSLISAYNLGRKFIGYEYNEEFKDIIYERLKNNIIL